MHGIKAPLLHSLNVRVCFFDTNDESIALSYSSLMNSGLCKYFPSLRDFRFTLSWAPGGSFVQSLVSVQDSSAEKTEQNAFR